MHWQHCTEPCRLTWAVGLLLSELGCPANAEGWCSLGWQALLAWAVQAPEAPSDMGSASASPPRGPSHSSSSTCAGQSAPSPFSA